MFDPVISIYVIALLFFFVAMAYSTVGLGGGSSYTALMVAFGFSILSIPLISLTLNILVTSVASYHFLAQKHGRFDLLFPFLISSIPSAYWGGSLQIEPFYFYWVLLLSLIVAAFRIYFWKSTSLKLTLTKNQKLVMALFFGGVLGLIAGIAGIGGGIFLVPLILIFNLGNEKEAAACAAIFIWLNSVAGLASRLQYNSVDLSPYVILMIAVVLGGWIGSKVGSSKLSKDTMERILGLIILAAIVLISKKLITQ